MRRFFGLCLFALPLIPVEAAPWTFNPAVAVTQAGGSGSSPVFHHLDSSGRRNIAATGQGVAVAWEDDRDGTPRVYLAYKRREASEFTLEVQVSAEGESYEPSLIALSGERVAIAWEAEDQVWLRLIRLGDKAALGDIHRLGGGRGAQANLVRERDGLAVSWSAREGRFGRIRLQRFAAEGLGLQALGGCPVDAAPPVDEQLYPSAALLNDRMVVAWEDRRPRHTIIMAAVEQQAASCRFGEPTRISEKPGGRNLPYGAGHGVARVAVTSVGADRLYAAWADKRNFRNGYDIWGAFYRIDQAGFGENERVQDDFGGLSKQRHASVSGNDHGNLVVAWDDEREGNADIMLSWREDDAWSDDWPLPVATGEGQQSNPSILLDAADNLHAAWVERDETGGATRLRYAFGRFTGN